MPERRSRVETAEAVASRWNELEIPFVIAHGLEDYPATIGRDLDIHMDAADAQRALREARRTLANAGWRTAVCPPPLWGARLVALTDDGDERYEYLEFHTASRFAWLAVPLVTTDISSTSSIGPFPIDYWTTFAKAIMLPLLAGDMKKLTPSYLASTWRMITSVESIEVRLTDLIGSRLAAEFLDASKTQDVARLESIRSNIRLGCLRYMVSNPSSTAPIVWPFLRKRFGRAFSNSGLRVRLVTPPEVDADDIASDIAEELQHIFVVTKISSGSHWAERLADQYNVLSRQGLVLELAEESSQERIAITVVDQRGPYRSASFATAESPKSLASWILGQWVDSLPCY